jgi:hypothetical protein
MQLGSVQLVVNVAATAIIIDTKIFVKGFSSTQDAQ